MEQAIYGDLYFAVNFTMDALALYLTAKLMHLPLSKWRLAAGGAVGALYSLLSLTLPDGNLLALLTALLLPALLCLITYGWQSTSAFLRQFIAFWVISFLLGGIMTAVCYAVASQSEKQVSVGGKTQPLMGDLPFWGILLIALLAGGLVSLILKKRKPTAELIDLTIEDRSSVTLRALVDSGNLLTEPLSGLPVIVIDRASAAKILPPELAFIASPTQNKPLGAGRLTATPRLRLIPCKTASGEAMLYGFLPSRILVAGQPRKACVAVSDRLAADSSYAAILPAILL